MPEYGNRTTMASRQLDLKQRVIVAIQHAAPTAAYRNREIGDYVLMYRDDPKAWVRPMVVIRARNKIVSLRGECS